MTDVTPPDLMDRMTVAEAAIAALQTTVASLNQTTVAADVAKLKAEVEPAPTAAPSTDASVATSTDTTAATDAAVNDAPAGN